MKNSISLYVIAIVIAISTVVRAQHRAPVVPFIDTIQYGNTVLIRSSTYSQAIPIPYEGVNPKEVYRAAKSGKKLVTTKENILFNLHSVQTITEYVYENNSWKSSITNIDLGILKETFLLYGTLFIFYIISFLLFKIKFLTRLISFDLDLFVQCVSVVFIFFLISVMCSSFVVCFFWKTKLYLLYNFKIVTVLFALWAILPFISKIKIRKNKKDTIVEPSPQ